MEKAKYLGLGGTCNLQDRWECPKCKEDPKKPEWRFTLSKKKRGLIHICRFCKIKLLLCFVKK